ncbi:MAG: hypothetical protein ACFB0A_00570 [Croceivirga sp.]
MMRISVFFIALCLITVLFSCKQEKKESDGQTRMQQVMAIHDEVMPKMGTLAKYTAELKAKVDTTEMGLQYEAAMKDLQNANSAMMDWMMAFGERFDSEEILNGKALTAQKLEWLNEEQEKVKVLQEQINSSIDRAQELRTED